MHRGLRALVGAAGSLLAGCQGFCVHDCYSSGPAPSATRTTVTVVPASADGHVGTVVIDPDHQRTVLNTAYGSAQVDQGRGAVAYTSSAEEVERRYHAVLQARPLAPVTFTAYFDNNTDQLGADSAALLEKLRAEIARRSNAEITVIGHTDRKGSDAHNDALAGQRAAHVRDQLIKSGIAAGMITAVSRGEREPLVETADGVPEPRNRRVEISIR